MILFWRNIIFSLCLLLPSHILAVDISEKLVVNFATEANYFPFEYVDDKELIQGFDIDIANAICQAANLVCYFHNHSFGSLLLTLQFGRFDAVIAALDITEERLSKVDFSNSYYQIPPVFVSPVSAQNKFSIVDKSIGVQTNSSNHHYLLQHAKENSFIISYFSSSEAFRDLRQGKIDMVFADKAVVVDFLLKDKNSSKSSINKTEKLFTEKYSSGYGIAVKKGNTPLLERLNYGLTKIKKEGRYKEIFSRYFKY